MNEAKMREEFEEWASEHSTMSQYLDRTVSGLYASSVTENFWNCWQASRAVPVVHLPTVGPEPEAPEEAIDDSYMDGHRAAIRMRNACFKAVEAAGVKVAS